MSWLFTDGFKFVLMVLTQVVLWAIELCSKILLFLVSFLIKVAQYNTFVDAVPVQNGWVLTRDVVNMFFIIVLLVVAFATIVGYQEFHYRAVLPKLLLMAVLINFSRTLVGILIDFSQVILLTFVSGFQQAAAGNFVQALQLTKITSMSKTAPIGEGIPDSDRLNLFIAAALGLAMVVISTGVVLMMGLFFVVRIIGLWILLILSPIAFFALALPGKMKSALSTFTNDWWSRLSGFLVGGPIMAFFLWLALATVQGSSNAFSGFYGSPDPVEDAQIQPAITQAAEPAALTAFLVAIVFLLMGLEQAIKITQQVSPQAMPLAKKALKITGKGASMIGGFAERKTGVTEGLGKGFIGAGRIFAGLSQTKVGKFIPGTGLLGGAVGRAGAALVTRNVERRERAAGAVRERVAKLPPELRLKSLETIEAANTGLFGAGLVGDADFREAAQMQGQQLRSTRGMQGILREKHKQQSLKAQRKAVKSGQRQIPPDEDEANAYAEGMAKREAAQANVDAQAIAKDRGDIETLDKLQEEQAKDPALYTDFAQLSRVAGNKIDDHISAYRDVRTEAWQDSATFLAYMKAVGLMDETSGKMVDGYKEKKQWKDLVQNGGNRAKYAEAHAFKLDNDTAYQTKAREQLTAMTGSSTADQKRDANNARYSVSSSSDGKQMVFVSMKPDGAAAAQKVALADIRGTPRDIGNYVDLVSKLSDGIRTALEGALTGAGIGEADRDILATHFDRPLTEASAAVIAANPNIISSAPARYTNEDMDAAKRLQILGYSSAAANINPQTHIYVNQDARAAHELNYGDALANAQDVQNVSFIANTNLTELATGGDLAQVVGNAVATRNGAQQVRTALESAVFSPELTQKMENFIKQIAKGAAKAADKQSRGEAVSVGEKNVLAAAQALQGLGDKTINMVLKLGRQQWQQV